MILHLVAQAEWEALKPDQDYVPKDFDKDGFIHCTDGDAMLLHVANSFYTKVQGNMLALSIDEKALKAEVKWEAAVHPNEESKKAEGRRQKTKKPVPPEVEAEMGNVTELPAQFPHIYGALNRAAVVSVRKFVRAADGSYVGYEALPKVAAAPIQNPSSPKTKTDPAGDLVKAVQGKTPSQVADDLVGATGEFSEALSRFQDRLKGKMDELDKNINSKL